MRGEDKCYFDEEKDKTFILRRGIVFFQTQEQWRPYSLHPMHCPNTKGSVKGVEEESFCTGEIKNNS